MALAARKARQICVRYYLDCASIADIASELHVSREAVRACVDDPAAQADYLQAQERARKRARIRCVSAAELALDRQIALLASRPTETALMIEQQRTAERVIKRALAPDPDNTGQIIIRWTDGPVSVAMPPGDEDTGGGGHA